MACRERPGHRPADEQEDHDAAGATPVGAAGLQIRAHHQHGAGEQRQYDESSERRDRAPHDRRLHTVHRRRPRPRPDHLEGDRTAGVRGRLDAQLHVGPLRHRPFPRLAAFGVDARRPLRRRVRERAPVEPRGLEQRRPVERGGARRRRVELRRHRGELHEAPAIVDDHCHHP